ncbi:hypothetical protein BH11PLA1_BH11PLA1_21460 [soil metagenome]
MNTHTSSLIALAALSLAGSALNADILLESALPTNTGHAVYVQNGVTITVDASPRNFARKTVNGLTGIGIADGNVTGEIDSSEYLRFTFSSAVKITGLSIAFLYADGNFGDVGNESAFIFANNAKYTLGVSTATSGTWTGGGTISNDSIANNSGGGGWVIAGNDIFSLGQTVTQIDLKAGNIGPNATYGDYAFRSVSWVVPAPGTGALAGLGLLAAARRRRAQ